VKGVRLPLKCQLLVLVLRGSGGLSLKGLHNTSWNISPWNVQTMTIITSITRTIQLSSSMHTARNDGQRRRAHNSTRVLDFGTATAVVILGLFAHHALSNACAAPRAAGGAVFISVRSRRRLFIHGRYDWCTCQMSAYRWRNAGSRHPGRA